MAEVLGVNAAKAASSPVKLVHQGENNGRVKVSFDSYKGAIALNDIIKLSLLPKGARVLEVVMAHASLGAAGLYKIGLEAGPYRMGNDGVLGAAADGSEFIVHSTKNVAICKAMSTIAGQTGQHTLYVDSSGKESVQAQVIATCTEAPTNANVELTVATYYVID
jgi:hypothetical protein